MRFGSKARVLAVVVCLATGASGCRSGHSVPAGPPTVGSSPFAHAAVALYNDTSSPVHVIGCVGCGRSGAALAPRRWLSFNMPADLIKLTIERATEATCINIVSGVATGKPFPLKVSDTVASAC